MSAIYRDHPSDPLFIQDQDLEFLIEPGKWFYDRLSVMKVRWDTAAMDEAVAPGDTWHFHTPEGPLTNKAYHTVKVADVNRDGQMDIIAAGPTGIDIFQQTGPSISDVGFVPKLPESSGPFDNHLSVSLGDSNGYINPTVIYDQFYELVYDEGIDGFHIRSMFTGAGGDDYFGDVQSTFCNEVTFFGYLRRSFRD